MSARRSISPNRRNGAAAVATVLLAACISRSAPVAIATPQPPDSSEAITNEGKDTNARRKGVSVSVQDMTFRGVSTVNAIHADIGLKLKIRNHTDQEISIDSGKFKVMADETASRFTRPVQGDFLDPRKTLAPGETGTGEMSFNVQISVPREPRLRLQWSADEQQVEVPLNSIIRNKWKLKTLFTGPNKCLAIVELNRPIDHAALWVLSDEFLKLKQAGKERVVLHVRTSERQSPSYTLRMSIGGWLSSVQSGQQIQRFPFGAQARSDVQFDTFFVTGIPDGMVRATYPGQTNTVQKPSRERAVADALRTAYTGIPLETALKDLDDPEPGVQLIAIEANLDRLSEQQLAELMAASEQRSVAQRVLLAGNLYRVPYSSVTVTLAELARSDHKEISAAAVSSLVRSVAPGAVNEVGNAWKHTDSADLRRSIVSAILTSNDHRYSELITSHATDLLDQYCKPVSESSSESKPTANSTTFRNVLKYLSNHDNQGFTQTLRSRLLEISDSAIQDQAMNFIRPSLTRGDESLAHSYISTRLAAANQINQPNLRANLSPEVIQTIKKFPDTRYTEQLLEVATTDGTSGSVRHEAFQVAVGCASHKQLAELIDNFDSYDSIKRTHLMRHLSAIDHPSWLQLARKCLEGDESTQHLALTVLHSSGSVEGLELIIDKLNTIREETAGDSKLEQADFRVVSKIMSNFQTATLPAARRVINRCNRSPNPALARLASDCIRNSSMAFFRSSPFLEDLKATSILREEGDYEGAIRGFTKILDHEIFFAAGYVSRGSLYMRTGKHDLAMQDLETANRLNPESAITESIIAIAKIRLGLIEEGIADAEELVKSVPDNETDVRRDTIYNAACVYGRAIESAADENAKTEYLRRGLDLLKSCVERKSGFDDVEHFLKDADLNSFHTSDEWSALVERVRRNEGERQP